MLHSTGFQKQLSKYNEWLKFQFGFANVVALWNGSGACHDAHSHFSFYLPRTGAR
jgi:hypothetical protein